ncbi:lysine-sensitive aspartokinase 3 [Enterobacter sp. CC120223-11]|uniref:lysine-sensitive aspartokinase 3 n=1 Tax=Enterobacter sp. CC120223-11 TaxID=1378073 RepID=UPI000BC435F4|nr:lysine-sensitive aspartokinase 3 [Enterobacter sp. CC120223-11]SNY63071.1 aspartate kinase [Enterobacter sp. CC120223-11]
MTRIYSPFVVAKFGGTSVANFDAMSRSASIVLADPQVRVVVLSASSGVTNLLVSLSEGLSAQDRSDKIETLRALTHAILSSLKQPDAVRPSIDTLLDSITRLADQAAQASSPALSDELVSHGELLSTLLFTAILSERGAKANWLDAREIIRTDSHFGCAEPDITAIAQQVQTRLLPHVEDSIVVTQGFIGSDADGRTTTLGRGGSDYTASLLGEALTASRVDIWTDVAGIYTTDPRIVPQAQRIDTLSFSEASDMAAYGAKVLHPATLMPAMRKNIPVFVGSSKNPEAGGTRVCRETENPTSYRALAVRRKQTLVKCRRPDAQSSVEFNARIFALLAELRLQAELVSTSENGIAWILDATHATSGDDGDLLTSLQEKLAAHCVLEVESGLALMTLVGHRLSQSERLCRDVFSQLDGCAVRMVCHGAGEHNLSVLLPGESADSAVKMLHKRLFEQTEAQGYAA